MDLRGTRELFRLACRNLKRIRAAGEGACVEEERVVVFSVDLLVSCPGFLVAPQGRGESISICLVDHKPLSLRFHQASIIPNRPRRLPYQLRIQVLPTPTSPLANPRLTLKAKFFKACATPGKVSYLLPALTTTLIEVVG
jgi:hypothetical protein